MLATRRVRQAGVVLAALAAIVLPRGAETQARSDSAGSICAPGGGVTVFAVLREAEGQLAVPRAYRAAVVTRIADEFRASGAVESRAFPSVDFWVARSGAITDIELSVPDTAAQRLGMALAETVQRIAAKGGVDPLPSEVRSDTVRMSLGLAFFTDSAGVAAPVFRYGGALLQDQVDRPPELLSAKPYPEYPEHLRESKVDGEVLAAFEVDTTGRPDITTFHALMSTHPDFSQAVRRVLSRHRYSPGVQGGCKVRVYIMQPFNFRLR